jgi:predicted RNase H-like HicB family nuclease
MKEPETFEEAVNNLKEAWKELITQIDEELSLSKLVIKLDNWISKMNRDE